MDEFENGINRIKKYFEDLEEYKGKKLEGKKDFYAASMIVFSILNDMLRVTEFFIARESFAAPATYKEMMDILAHKKIISQTLANKMKLLVSGRNMISHEYGEIKASDVESMITQMQTVKEFIALLSRKYNKS